MKVRTAKKIVDKASRGVNQPGVGKLEKALKVIWYQSRHADGVPAAGRRMSESISQKTIHTVATVMDKISNGHTY